MWSPRDGARGGGEGAGDRFRHVGCGLGSVHGCRAFRVLGRGLRRRFRRGQQVTEQARPGTEFVQGAGVDDPAVVKDGDPVGEFQGRSAVRDDQRGATPGVLAQPVVDLRLHPGVDGRRGVVEDEDRRVADERAGESHPLALSPGEGEALFPDDGVVPLGQPFDELVGPGDPGRRPHLLVRRVRDAVRDIGAHGVGEQQALLEDEADPGAQGRQGEFAYVAAAHPYRT